MLFGQIFSSSMTRVKDNFFFASHQAMRLRSLLLVALTVATVQSGMLVLYAPALRAAQDTLLSGLTSYYFD
jgi:hypothetical protein